MNEIVELAIRFGSGAVVIVIALWLSLVLEHELAGIDNGMDHGRRCLSGGISRGVIFGIGV